VVAQFLLNQKSLPGKRQITVKYNMALGPIRKTLTVESNAVNYEGGRVALKIKGKLFRLILIKI
jgi:hypothetical protein